MKANHLLDEYTYFSSKDSNTKHTLYFDENIHRSATLLQNSVFRLKIINGFGDCGVLAILFSILSGEPDIQKKIWENVYEFMCNFDKAFELKEPATEIFQIKYFRQALFHAKIYANATDGQKYSIMNDPGDFKGDDDIYEIKKVVELHTIKVNLTEQLTRTPKPNDKEAIKIQIANVNKEFNDIHLIFKKNYNEP